MGTKELYIYIDLGTFYILITIKDSRVFYTVKGKNLLELYIVRTIINN